MPVLCSLASKLLLIVLASGQARLDRPLLVGGTDDCLQYDDGTAALVFWDYCGVWFDTQDFVPVSAGGSVYQLQFWFYHSTGSPWDTSSFYAELWNGDDYGPLTQLDQTSVTATHFAPVYADYSPAIAVEQNFWGIANTEMSTGGWPSALADFTPNFTGYPHSFVESAGGWVPWDLLIRADAYIPDLQLTQTSWGSIKTLF